MDGEISLKGNVKREERKYVMFSFIYVYVMPKYFSKT